MTNELMRCDVVLKTVDVILFDSIKSSEKKYKLIELIGKDSNGYMDQMKDRTEVGKDGKITVTTFDGFQADLLQKSLFDENGDAATKDFIESLPASVQTKLFERAQKLSGLDVTKEDKEKKD